jgi:hypothetical protein
VDVVFLTHECVSVGVGVRTVAVIRSNRAPFLIYRWSVVEIGPKWETVAVWWWGGYRNNGTV